MRAALGARTRDIVGLVLRQSMSIVIAGIVIGLMASIWLSQALRGVLFGVTPHDAVSIAGVAVGLLVVATIATIGPARRAAAVDPVRVLRG